MHSRSLLFRREPAWRDAPTVHSPAVARSWLEEPASLTARLRRLAGPGFGVRLLGQGFGKPFAGEAALLGLPSRRHALAREVVLRHGSTPLVLARTVMPPTALRGAHCGLARLGSRPLGEVLFNYRGLRRARLQFARIAPADWLPGVAQEFGLDMPVWARRSVYVLGPVSVLVCECFLPALLSLSEPL